MYMSSECICIRYGNSSRGANHFLKYGGLFYGREAISSFSGGLMQYLAASDKFLEGL